MSERTVQELMRRDFVVVSDQESLDEARRIMRLGRLRHLLVERDGILVGILSYRDLQEDALEGRPEPVGVVESMVASPYVVTPETALESAASRLSHLHIGCLPVVVRTPAGPRLVGLVTESDLLRAASYPARRT